MVTKATGSNGSKQAAGVRQSYPTKTVALDAIVIAYDLYIQSHILTNASQSQRILKHAVAPIET